MLALALGAVAVGEMNDGMDCMGRDAGMELVTVDPVTVLDDGAAVTALDGIAVDGAVVAPVVAVGFDEATALDIGSVSSLVASANAFGATVDRTRARADSRKPKDCSGVQERLYSFT